MSDGGEVDEIGQQLGRTGAAVLSAALVAARIAMQRRAERAEAARRADQQRQQQAARELHAERQLAAVEWERVNLRQWFRENPQEVAKTWASAATWAEQDPRAAEAFESLNLHLDALRVHDPEVIQAKREAKDYEALAELLKQGADEAYGRLSGHAQAAEADTEAGGEAGSGAPAGEVARWERVGLTRRFDSVRQLGKLWASAKEWARYDARAAEAAACMDTELAHRNVRIPGVEEVGPEPPRSEALAELLDKGAAHAGQHSGPEGDFVRFGAWYIREPANALAALHDYLGQVRHDQPGYFAALERKAQGAGADNLITWFAEHLDEAYAVSREHFTQTEGATSPASRDGAAQPAAGQPSTRLAASAAPSIYQNAAPAAKLAGLGFAMTTAEVISRRGRHAAPSRRQTRAAARAARKQQEHGRG